MNTMTVVRVLGVEEPGKRQYSYVRVFGYLAEDKSARPVEVAVTVSDACEIIDGGSRDLGFPDIEVPDTAWTFCLNSGGVPVIQYAEVPDA